METIVVKTVVAPRVKLLPQPHSSACDSILFPRSSMMKTTLSLMIYSPKLVVELPVEGLSLNVSLLCHFAVSNNPLVPLILTSMRHRFFRLNKTFVLGNIFYIIKVNFFFA